MEIVPFQPVDMISNLPNNVIDNILMCLTTRDAAKTSILSTKWRYKWVKLPQLIFDDTLWQVSKSNQESTRMKFVVILYQVLLLHQGPITKLSLIMPELTSCSEIDYLIYILWKKGVEEFTFKIKEGEEYKLPSSLFMCSRLKHLNLSSCWINPPAGFKGFNRMYRLELRDITIDDEVLESLISSCPLLEQLVLHVPNKFDYLEINAPMLKFLELICHPTHVCIKNSPLLAIVLVAAHSDNAEYKIMKDGNYFIEFFDSLPALQKLCMEYQFMEIMCADQVQTMLPATLIHLKILKIFDICLDSSDELSWVLCLIRGSPNLEKLKIEILNSASADASLALEFLKAKDNADVLLNGLQKVKLKSVTGTGPEMAFIKLLLEKSSNLTRMVILPNAQKIGEKGFMILKELNKFVRASPNAKVIYED